MAVAETLLFLYTVIILFCVAQTVNYTTEPSSTTFSMFTTTAEDCICGCSFGNSSSDVEQEIIAIQEKLYLDSTTTSQYRRKRTSAEDKRPSAQGIGYSGILLLVASFLFFFISDVINFFMYLDKKKASNPAAVVESSNHLD